MGIKPLIAIVGVTIEYSYYGTTVLSFVPLSLSSSSTIFFVVSPKLFFLVPKCEWRIERGGGGKHIDFLGVIVNDRWMVRYPNHWILNTFMSQILGRYRSDFCGQKKSFLGPKNKFARPKPTITPTPTQPHKPRKRPTKSHRSPLQQPADFVQSPSTFQFFLNVQCQKARINQSFDW